MKDSLKAQNKTWLHQAFKERSMRKCISFVIGTKYSLQNVPRPTDKNIKLRQVPGHTLAVRKFSGPPPTDEKVEQERKYLEESLSKANLMAKNADTLVYGYHDPFITPNFLRRNEVAVVIDGKV